MRNHPLGDAGSLFIWRARLVPNLQKREQEKADNEWRESNDSYRNFISERQKEALRKMRLVFSRLIREQFSVGRLHKC